MPELDLHGYTVDEALKAFRVFYNKNAGAGVRLRIIHGYGAVSESARILRKLREFLATAAASLDWKPGEDIEGNPGVTIVYPRKKLPSAENHLEQEILEFCSVPRTESKIAGQLRKHPPREVKAALRALVRRGELNSVVKSSETAFVSVSGEERLKSAK
jgi:hypothetical protein